MRGMDGALDDLVVALGQRVAPELEELEAVRGWDDGTLPRPGLVDRGQRPRLEEHEWPAILVVPVSLDGRRTVDRSGAAETYRSAYRVRVYLFVRADGFEAVETLRARYALAVSEVLLESPGLRDDGTAAVDPTSLRESYSDVLPDEVGRSVGAMYVELVVDLEESVTRSPLHPGATGVDVTAVPVPHPALT